MFRGRSEISTVCGFIAVAFLVAACGGPLEGASAPSGSSQTSSATPAPPPTSPMPAESAADAICGGGWRWDGVHCVASAFGSSDVAASSSGSSGGDADAKKRDQEQANAKGPHVTIEEIKIGSGAEAHENSHVRIHYVGKLTDGTTFDSSRDRNEPFSFTIGIGEVIRGFDQGVTGMKVGGLRRVQIPPALGYGRRGAPPKIPPDATLHFEIELLGVE
ncbi:MAG: FKBP-type peptidyl-prolyl cis-trans isomerase [Polyangiaceae bacterium]